MITVITTNNYKEYKIGNKAYRLFEMKEKGLNVPAFFCVNELPDKEELNLILDSGAFICPLRGFYRFFICRTI